MGSTIYLRDGRCCALGVRSVSPPTRCWSYPTATRSSGAPGDIERVSACGVGSLPRYFDNISPSIVAGTFFVGSIFFTTAAYLQYHEVLGAPEGVLADSTRPRPLLTLVGWTPRRLDWWAATVQLVGTVFFNVTTFAATRSDLTVTQDRRLIWAPDVLGSVCFLVASWLAYSEVNRGTFVGAVGFLAGSVLLPVESARDSAPDQPTIAHPG